MISLKKQDGIGIQVLIGQYYKKMKPEKEKEILEMAVAVYGVRSQLDMWVEESAELTKAICKAKRANLISTLRFRQLDEESSAEDWKLMHDILSEMVDVQIMLDQMKIMLEFMNPNEAMALIRERKLERLANKLKITNL